MKFVEQLPTMRKIPKAHDELKKLLRREYGKRGERFFLDRDANGIGIETLNNRTPVVNLFGIDPQYFQNVSFLTTAKDVGTSILHSDYSRGIVLNFPIRVDQDNSYCIIGKINGEDNYHLKKETKFGNGGLMRIYEFDPELFSYYKLNTAVLMNSSVPHAWFANMEEDRIICSIAFDPTLTIEEVYEMLPDKWKDD